MFQSCITPWTYTGAAPWVSSPNPCERAHAFHLLFFFSSFEWDLLLVYVFVSPLSLFFFSTWQIFEAATSDLVIISGIWFLVWGGKVNHGERCRRNNGTWRRHTCSAMVTVPGCDGETLSSGGPVSRWETKSHNWLNSNNSLTLSSEQEKSQLQPEGTSCLKQRCWLIQYWLFDHWI